MVRFAGVTNMRLRRTKEGLQLNDQIKNFYGEASVELAQARALIDQFDGMEMPSDVDKQINKLLAAMRNHQFEARLIERKARTKTLSQPTKETAAFEVYLHRGEQAPAQVIASLNTVGGEDSYLVPDLYNTQFSVDLYEMSILRETRALILTLGDSLDSESAVDEVIFTPYQYISLARMSQKVAAEERFPIWASILRPHFAAAFAMAENYAFINGTGSGQPEGLLTRVPLGVELADGTGQVDTIRSTDGLIDLYNALDQKYRSKAAWMMNTVTLNAVQKLKYHGGQYVWQAGLQSGQPDTIMDRPVIDNPAMPVPTANAKTILFGDLCYFWIGERQGLRLKVLTDEPEMVGVEAYRWIDSHVVRAEAFQCLRQAAA